MDTKLNSFGYDFEPSRYSPNWWYSRLKFLITSQPAGRYFDVKTLQIPTFDGRLYHQTHVTRHELSPDESFQVCLGEMKLESHRGEYLRAFSFGGSLHASVEGGDLVCEITSTAPFIKLQDDPDSIGEVFVDELQDFLAEKEAHLGGHEHELYARLAKIEPYDLFLSSLASLQKRSEGVPVNLRHDQYHKVVAQLHRVTKMVKEKDGWDGRAPTLDELL